MIAVQISTRIRAQQGGFVCSSLARLRWCMYLHFCSLHDPVYDRDSPRRARHGLKNQRSVRSSLVTLVANTNIRSSEYETGYGIVLCTRLHNLLWLGHCVCVGNRFARIVVRALKEMLLCTECSGKSSTIDKGTINMKMRDKVSLDLENIEFELNTREFV